MLTNSVLVGMLSVVAMEFTVVDPEDPNSAGQSIIFLNILSFEFLSLSVWTMEYLCFSLFFFFVNNMLLFFLFNCST